MFPSFASIALLWSARAVSLQAINILLLRSQKTGASSKLMPLNGYAAGGR
jgi:hypothetical protein